MKIQFNILFKMGCLGMLTFLGMGARYGHTGTLEQNSTTLFHKAQLYHFANSIIIIIEDTGLLMSSLIVPSIPLKIAVAGFVGGYLFFVGPLYWVAITGKRQWLSKCMPLGGVSMMLAWVSLIFS